MLRKKLRESLTARVFLFTFFILLGGCCITFALIAWVTPKTYTLMASSELQQRTELLTETLARTDFEACGPVIDDFIRSAGADVILLDEQGKSVSTPSKLASQIIYDDETIVVAEVSGARGTALNESWDMQIAAEKSSAHDLVSMTNSVVTTVTFADRPESYRLYASSYLREENQVVEAMRQTAPWLLTALLLFSVICAWLYSRWITRPIVRISGIAKKMANLDFHWKCGMCRRDEIGALGSSLDQMAQSLSTALDELKTANEALRGEVEQERALERQRLAFFSAASHELKTPITILKGQLSGMLDGVDIYQDREKYLARSLQVTARMEGLVQEILTISRMEAQGSLSHGELLDLSELVQQQVACDTGLMEQRRLRLEMHIEDELWISGEKHLIAKAIGNLLSNAALYSPEGETLRVQTGLKSGQPTLTVENTGVHIREEALPHLFEAFYREDPSRNRRTGGSGLGLYLVQMIAERHKGKCTIENTAEGVKAVLSLPAVQ